MARVGIVSCDKWLGKLEEDINLKNELINLGIDAHIISWQQPLCESYDALILRSVWGYQDHYNEFKEWLSYIENNGIILLNDFDLIKNNINKEIQFSILKKNGIKVVDTYFISKYMFNNSDFLDSFKDGHYVIKPSISGSGENTFIINDADNLKIKNTIKKSNVRKIYMPILENNDECKIMIQPFIPEINNGEYSCIFINGILTHTMIRFPNIFHDKKRPYLLEDIPSSVIKLATEVSNIPEYRNYLYMRVDMVLSNGVAQIMEVELADPDLLTKYIENIDIKTRVIKTFAKKIERRIR